MEQPEQVLRGHRGRLPEADRQTHRSLRPERAEVPGSDSQPCRPARTRRGVEGPAESPVLPLQEARVVLLPLRVHPEHLVQRRGRQVRPARQDRRDLQGRQARRHRVVPDRQPRQCIAFHRP